jgi:hypothetical protein
MDIMKLVTGILLLTGAIAGGRVAIAAEPTRFFPNAAVVMLPPGSKPPASVTIIPSGRLFGCRSAPIAQVRSKTDSGLTSVLLGGRALLGYQKPEDSDEEALPWTVFLECGKEIHRMVVKLRVDPVGGTKEKKMPSPEEKTGEIVLLPSGTAIQEAQEAVVKEKDAEGEGHYSVQISATDLNLFICDGVGPVSLRLPALPYVETGEVIPSGTNPDAAYLKVNEAAFDGNGEYRSAHDLWVTCGGIETKLEVYPGKMPGQIVVIK